MIMWYSHDHHSVKNVWQPYWLWQLVDFSLFWQLLLLSVFFDSFLLLLVLFDWVLHLSTLFDSFMLLLATFYLLSSLFHSFLLPLPPFDSFILPFVQFCGLLLLLSLFDSLLLPFALFDSLLLPLALFDSLLLLLALFDSFHLLHVGSHGVCVTVHRSKLWFWHTVFTGLSTIPALTGTVCCFLCLASAVRYLVGRRLANYSSRSQAISAQWHLLLSSRLAPVVTIICVSGEDFTAFKP